MHASDKGLRASAIVRNDKTEGRDKLTNSLRLLLIWICMGAMTRTDEEMQELLGREIKMHNLSLQEVVSRWRFFSSISTARFQEKYKKERN